MIYEMNAIEEPNEYKDFGKYLKDTYKFSNEHVNYILCQIHKLVKSHVKFREAFLDSVVEGLKEMRKYETENKE